MPRNLYGRPFLKWAGGKFSQLDLIFDRMPGGTRLVEPFVGAGSVFMNAAGFDSYLLSDTNKDLINTYQQAIKDPMAFKVMIAKFFLRARGESDYDMVKELFNDKSILTPLERAAAFVFMNKTGFNGLSRYNMKGEFNTPYGKRQSPAPIKEIDFFCSCNVSKNSFVVADFQETIARAGSGDVVYCDPPYLPDNIQMDGTFKKASKIYSAEEFTLEDHSSLVESCVRAHNRGAKILINNSKSEYSTDLYRRAGFTVYDVVAKRSISCNSDGRKNVMDILARLA